MLEPVLRLDLQEEEGYNGPDHEVEANGIRGVAWFIVEAVYAKEDDASSIGEPE